MACRYFNQILTHCMHAYITQIRKRYVSNALKFNQNSSLIFAKTLQLKCLIRSNGSVLVLRRLLADHIISTAYVQSSSKHFTTF